MPNVIQFEVHDPIRLRRARRRAAPRRLSAEASAPNSPRPLSRILVASDGTGASASALLVAGLLARQHRATVDVVSVLPRWGEPPAEHEFLAITRELLEERLAAVIPQGERAFEHSASAWNIRVIDSTSAAESIAETALTEGHDLIVTGNRRSWITRWLRRPTGLAVAQRSSVPVLVVPRGVSTLPTRAVVGVGGGPLDRKSIATTMPILSPGAAVHLARVDSADVSATRETEGLESTPRWAVKFAELEKVIHDHGGVADVRRVVLRGGDPSDSLVSYAKTAKADLLVASISLPTTIGSRLVGREGRRIVLGPESSVLLIGANN